MLIDLSLIVSIRFLNQLSVLQFMLYNLLFIRNRECVKLSDQSGRLLYGRQFSGSNPSHDVCVRVRGLSLHLEPFRLTDRPS